MAQRVTALLLIALFLLLPACAQDTGNMRDGYYTAEAADFEHGWKEFVTICVREGAIVTVEYNAKNPSGFIKSWDMSYMAAMNGVSGTYPNAYTRSYAADLLATQSADGIDAITGASHSYSTFRLLAAAAIEHSRRGDTTVAVVGVQ